MEYPCLINFGTGKEKIMDHQIPGNIRKPAVAGMFYPDNATELKSAVEGYLSHQPIEKDIAPSILIVPHAGYIYSGVVASKAFDLLQNMPNSYTHVAIMGPPHRVYLDKIAISSAKAFSTPLGQIQVDHDRLDQLKAKLGSIVVSDNAHLKEHCIEVQLPFLQTVLHDFKLLPLLVGNLSVEDVSHLIKMLTEFKDTLIVISTDLSHFLPYHEAKKCDEKTTRQIESFDYQSLDDHSACGLWALRGALHFASVMGMGIQRLALQNSGDTSGHRDQVVGYGAWAIYEQNN